MRWLNNQPWYTTPPTKAQLTEGLHWNMWKRRLPPFNDLQEGDRVFLVRPDGHGGSNIAWEVEVARVVRSAYRSKEHAWQVVRDGFPGRITKSEFINQDYTDRATDEGWVLAWVSLPVREVRVARPSELRFRPNGWLNLERLSDRQLQRWGIAGGLSGASGPNTQPMAASAGAARSSDAKRNRAVELRAMKVARKHMMSKLGWTKDEIRDTSSNQPYDFECRRGNKIVRVEVKGLSGAPGSVILTRGEVEHARLANVKTILVVVSGIQIEDTDTGELRGVGGELVSWDPWHVDRGRLVPASFDYTPPLPGRR